MSKKIQDKMRILCQKIQDKMTNQTLALTKFIASTWKVTYNKVRHIYKTMIKSNIICESIA